MRDLMGAAIAKYGAIVMGLLIGTAAKYGLALTEGKRLSIRAAIADLLLLGMLGFLAIVVSDGLSLTGNARVLAGAVAAVSSDRLIRLVRDRFMKAADGQLSKLIPPPEKEAIMHVPPGIGEPAEVGVEAPPLTRVDRAGASLKKAYPRAQGRVPEDQIEALRALDRLDDPKL